ncbi:hypothetical protein MBANPS3_011729 [Mucor bainieri]
MQFRLVFCLLLFIGLFGFIQAAPALSSSYSNFYGGVKNMQSDYASAQSQNAAAPAENFYGGGLASIVSAQSQGAVAPIVQSTGCGQAIRYLSKGAGQAAAAVAKGASSFGRGCGQAIQSIGTSLHEQ